MEDEIFPYLSENCKKFERSPRCYKKLEEKSMTV